MNSKFQTKGKLYKACVDSVEKRILTIQTTIDSIEESRNNETKSSSGDKYETGRAMMQIEREKAGKQMHEAMRLKAELKRIDPKKKSENIVLGSLVSTSNGDYFISIGLGKISIEEQIYFCISLQSPIGMKLFGKRKGEEIEFNEKKIRIEEVL